LLTASSIGSLRIWPSINWNLPLDDLVQTKNKQWSQKSTTILEVVPKAQVKLREYKIGMLHWIAYSPLNVAQVKKFWQKENVNVKVINFSENRALYQSLINKRIHFAMAMIGTWVGMNQDGLDLTIIGETDWSHGGDKIIAKKGLKFSQIKGKTIGVYLDEPSVTFFLYQFLKQINVKLSEVNLLEFSSERLTSNFIANRLPIIVNYDPQALRAERNGNGVVIATSSDNPGIIPEGIAMLTDVYQLTPKEDLIRIIKAWFRAVEWIKQEDNWQEYATILNAHTYSGSIDYSDEDLKLMLASVRIHDAQTSRKHNSEDGALIRYLHDLKSFLKNNGFLKIDFLPEKLFDNSIFANALAEKNLLPEIKEEVDQPELSKTETAEAKSISNVRLTYSEWSPFISKKLPYFGPASQIVTESFAQQGLQLELEYIFFDSWQEAFDKAKMEEFDGSFVWLKTPERSKFFHFSEPVLYDTTVIFHKKSYPLEFNTVFDLKGIRIGACKRYHYGNDFRRAETENIIYVKRYDTDLELMQLLIKGEIDAAVLQVIVGIDILRNHFSEAEQQQITYHTNSIHTGGYRLMISLKHPGHNRLIKSFNQGLKHMKRSGRLKQIMDALKTEKPVPDLTGQIAANIRTHEYSQISSIKLASTSWPPFMGETLKNQGFLTEIVMEAFKEIGLLEVDVDFMPWDQAVEKSVSGEYDALMGEYYNDERARQFLISTPVMNDLVALFKLKGKMIPPAKTLEDLIPYSIGVVKGYINSPEFDAYPKLNRITANSDARNLHNLLSGKADLIAIDPIVANFILKKQYTAHLDVLQQFGKPLSFQQLYVMFSKRNKHSSTLLKCFNDGLQGLRQNGKLDRILEKHQAKHLVRLPENKTICVVSDNQMPFNGLPVNDKSGYLIDILKAIFESQGYNITYKAMPWNYALYGVQNGQFDAILRTTRGEGSRLIFPKESVGLLNVQFMVRKNSTWRFQGISSLEKMRLGCVSNYDYGPHLTAYIQNPLNVENVIGTKGICPLCFLVDKLLNQDIDVFLGLPSTVRWMLSQKGMPADAIVSAGTNLKQWTPLHIAFTPNKSSSRLYAQLFDDGIRQLRENGELEKILDHYDVVDWKNNLSETVSLITEEYTPVSMKQDGWLTGAGVEIVREMARRLNQPGDINLLSWDEGYKLAINQPNVGLILPQRTPKKNIRFKWVGPLVSVGTDDTYLAFSSQTPDTIVEKWQQALDTMKEDGSFSKIHQQWLPDEPVPGETLVIYPGSGSEIDSRYAYHWNLLKSSLEKTKGKYGPYRLISSKSISSIDEKKQVQALVNENNELSIIVKPTSQELEEQLCPIRIPLDRGLLGYRIFLTHKDSQTPFSAIQTLEDLKTYIVGQGADESDVPILQHNGFQVNTNTDYDNLFKLLIKGKFDFISRGIHEAPVEYEALKNELPDLHLEESIVLHYPFARYFWFANNDSGKKLARRIEEGLIQMIDDKSFDKIFFQHYSRFIQKANLTKRKIFRIENPFLTKKTQLMRKELWYNPFHIEKEENQYSKTPLTLLTQEYPPFHFSKNGKPTGLYVELVKEILRRENRNDPIQIVQWKDGFQRVLKEENSAIFSTTRFLNNEYLFKWVGPIGSVQKALYARKDSGIRLNSLAEVESIIKIAVQKNSGALYLEKKGLNNLYFFSDVSEGLLALHKGWVDLLDIKAVSFKSVATSAGIDPKNFEPVLYYAEWNDFIVFSKSTADRIVDQWQTRLNQIKSDNTYDRIRKKWLGQIEVCQNKKTYASIVKNKLTQEEIETARKVDLTIMTEDWPPVNFTKNGQLTGLSVELVREMLHRMGQADNIQVKNWAEAYKITLKQHKTALFSTSRT